MALLITGGTGFLGSYLARYALNEGGQDRVVVLERYPERPRIADVLDRVTLIEGDVADAAQVAAVMGDYGIDKVAHFAFILGSPPPGKMPDFVRVCCQGTVNVLEAARLAGVRRLVFASSVAAYGSVGAALLAEDTVANPQGPYGSFKLWAEALVDHYATNLGLDALSLRYGSTYGLGRAWRGSYNSTLISKPQDVHYMARVEDAVRGRAITMPAGDAVADFTYAADAAKAAWLALTKDRPSHRLYNVSSERLPVGQFTAAMRALLPRVVIAERPDESPGHPHTPMDNSRLVEDFGFSPDFHIADGLADYVERIRIADAYLESPSG